MADMDVHSEIAAKVPAGPDMAALEAEAHAGSAVAMHRLGECCIDRDAGAGLQEGMAWLLKAAVFGHVESYCLLGDIHLKEWHKGADYYVSGADWYRKAADTGHAGGQVRLAYLYLSGIGVSEDHEKAYSWYEKAANQGAQGMQSNLAYMHAHGIGTSQDEAEATRWYMLAAENGDARGFYNLGLRLLGGTGVPLDYGGALVCLNHAVKLGYPGSEELYRKLTASQPVDRLLEIESVAVEVAPRICEPQARGVILPDGLQLDEEFVANVCAGISSLQGKSPETEVVCLSPRVFKVHNFLSLDECDHLVDMAIRNSGKTEASLGKDLVAGSALDYAGLYKGLTAFFESPVSDATVFNIEKRIEKTTFMPCGYGEPLSVLYYGKGDGYPDHVDYFRPDDPVGAKIQARIGQRIITFLMYLSDVEEGGETAYLRAARKVVPKKGMAVMHFNCLPSGEVDEMSCHAGLPIRKGGKWLARRAICDRDQRVAATIEQGPKPVYKAGRNSPCPCGSGKKYKKCCGK